LVRRRCVTWEPSCPLKEVQSPNFRPMSIVAKRLDESKCHLVRRYRPRPMPHCVRRGPSSPRKGDNSPLFLAHVYYGHDRPSQLLLSSCYFISFLRPQILLTSRSHAVEPIFTPFDSLDVNLRLMHSYLEG